MDFATILKEIRKEKTLTQKELSEKLGFSKNAICEWEKGRCEPSITVLKKISNLFNLSIDYLVGNSDEFGAITVEGPELTQTEKQLLSNFRGADEIGKRSILITAQAFFNQAQENSKKPV